MTHAEKIEGLKRSVWAAAFVAQFRQSWLRPEMNEERAGTVAGLAANQALVACGHVASDAVSAIEAQGGEQPPSWALADSGVPRRVWSRTNAPTPRPRIPHSHFRSRVIFMVSFSNRGHSPACAD